MKKKTISKLLSRALCATMALALAGTIAGCAKSEPEADATKVASTGHLTIEVNADEGWTKDSTPAIAHIVGSKDDATEDNDDVDFYHAVNPSKDNHGTSAVEVPAGDYTVEFVSPLNNDGSAYVIYDTGKTQTVTVEAVAEKGLEDVASEAADKATEKAADAAKAEKADEDAKTDKADADAAKADDKAVADAVKDAADDAAATDKEDAPDVKQDITRIPADQVTDDMLKDIVDKVNTAVENGDETLKGDAGKEIVDKLEQNVKANPNASDETKKDAEQTAETEAVNTPAAEPTKAPEPEAQKPSGSNKPSAGNTGNSGNSGSTATQPSEPSKPAHQHHWVTKTETYTENVTKTREVPYQETETTYDNVLIAVCDCGAEFSSGTTWTPHAKETGCFGFHSEIRQVAHNNTVTKYRTETYTEPVTKTRSYTVCDGCGQHQ